MELFPRNDSGQLLKQDFLNVRGVVLKSQLYGGEKYLCADIDDHTILSGKGMKTIIAAVRKRESLSKEKNMYRDLNELLNVRRAPSETLRN